MSLPRSTIDELITKYELEPDLDDVYVEGSYDKEILDAALKHLNIQRPVYEIDTVEISADVLESYGFTDGQRQRVIVLSKLLSLGQNTPVRFLADKDFDDLLGVRHVGDGLVFTKYNDIESVFFSEDKVRNLIEGAGSAKIKLWDVVHRNIEDAVRKIAAVRIALRDLNINIKLSDISKSITIENDSLVCDVKDICTRTCGSSSAIKIVGEVEKSANKWLAILSSKDLRLSTRGHDYTFVMAYVIKKFRGSSAFANAIDRTLILLVPDVAHDILEPIM